MKRILLTLILLVTGIILFAQVPTSFNYQAVVRDSQGEVLANQSISFRISILQGSSSGTTVYSETHSKTSNDYGVINLQVGKGNASSGSISSISWDSGPFYLKIEVDTEGGSSYTTMGTSELLTVPYAMYAGTVSDKDDADPDPENEIQDLELVSDILSITMNASATDIDLSKYLDNTDNQTLTLDNNQLSISSGNTVNLASGSSLWSMDGSDIYYTAGNVGIGVDKPNSRLEVKGNIDFTETDTLFLVKDKEGQPVFAVFADGVEIYVDEGSKGTVGGFAVSGRSATKAGDFDIMKVTPDSTRIYVNDAYRKGNVGGFAVSGRSATKGTSSKFLNLSPENYFIGHESGHSITTGAYNSFFGYQSGYSTTTGDRNVFLGYKVGYTNDEGIDNIFVGNKAGYFNEWGSYNVFIGDSSGFSNTIGRSNVAIGKLAGLYNTEGNFNVMLGTWAGKHNTTGSQNVFLGQQAGESNTEGSFNAIIGTLAGDNNETGLSNVFLGRSAGEGNTSGSYNVTIGTHSGHYLTEGDQNVILGQQAGYHLGRGKYNTMLGAFAGGSSIDSSFNVFIGYASGYNTSGSDNVILGSFAGYDNYGGDKNVFLGYGAGYNESGSNKLYIENSTATSSSALIYGDFYNDRLRFNGKIGINYLNTSIFELYILGDAYASEGWWVPAAKSGETKSTGITEPLNKILQLEGIVYTPMKEKDTKTHIEKQLGIHTTTLEKNIPEAVRTNESGEKAIDYGQITPVLIEAIKEQQKQIEALKAEIDKLKSEEQ